MTEPIRAYVFGAGTHGRVVAATAQLTGRYRLEGFLDDDPNLQRAMVRGLPVVGGREDLDRLSRDAVIIPGLGENRTRKSVCEAAVRQGFRLGLAVHPTAVISEGVVLGEGTFVGPKAVVHLDARVGTGCIVNTGSVVEHDCVLEDWVHISPCAALAGKCRVGEGAHMGLNSCLLPGISLGKWSQLGAGAVAVSAIPDQVCAIGVPAKVVRPTA